jgi:hypothetical protein
MVKHLKISKIIKHMPYLSKVTRPLTNEEIEEISHIFRNPQSWFTREIKYEAEEDHPLKLYGNCNHTIYSHVLNYAFLCNICKDEPLWNPWYRIIAGEIGGSRFLHQGTRVKDLFIGFNGSNIKKIEKEDKEEYFSSGLNFTKEIGYVCNHCKDSCFDESGNLLKN